MRRGEVWQVHLDPVQGNEANKTRRCVIVSNNGRNSQSDRSGRGVITIVPFTKNVSRILEFQAFVTAEPGNGLEVDSKAQCEQVRAVDVGRFVNRLGMLNAEQMAAVDDALIVHLALD